MQSLNHPKQLWARRAEQETASTAGYDSEADSEDPGGPHCCWNLCPSISASKTPRPAVNPLVPRHP